MKPRSPSWQLTALLSLLLLALMAAPAGAQKTTIPASMTAVKREQAWWVGQLRLAREIGQKTLVGLQHAPTDERTPIDESVYQAARDTYVLIRAAQHGVMEAVRDDKWHDPLLEITAKKVTAAWHLSRSPVDKAQSSMPRQEYLTVAIHDLQQSMRLVDQVLILLP